jgi:hypothetical protein
VIARERQQKAPLRHCLPEAGALGEKKRRGGGEERTMTRLTKKKIRIQSILKNEWSKTGGISNFLADC